MRLEIEGFIMDLNIKNGYILYKREHNYHPYVIHRFNPMNNNVSDGDYFRTLEEASEAFHRMTEPDDLLNRELEEMREKLERAEELITKIAENGFMPDMDEREIYREKPEQRKDDEIGDIVYACRQYLGWNEEEE